MQNPSDLVDLIVAAVSSITTVVSELDGDSSAVQSYEDAFPGSTTIMESIFKLKSPAILVVYNGLTTADYKRGSVWDHKFSLILKTKNTYSDLITAIINGVPIGSLYNGLKFRRMTIHSSCDPIKDVAADRRQLFLSEFSSIDYWEISFILSEKGIDA